MFARLSLFSLLASSLAAGLSYDNVDKAATPRAKELLKYVQSQYGSHYISGQQDLASLEWVKQNIGVTPAILGTDLIYYSPSAVSRGGKSGINALVWHWYAPNCLLETDKQPWYRGFYTEATCFNVANAVDHRSNKTDYRLLIRDIDAIAVQLKRLSEANVPVLFRPLHEPEGGWFWWGAQGPAPFKKLWNIIYDCITRVHNIHNIVWVCNTADPKWYPGNDKCDIATVDHYSQAGDHGVVLGDKFHGLQNVTKGERVLALAEVGSITDPELQAKQHVPWAYWMTWNDEFFKDGKHNSKQFLQDTFNNKRVVTIDGTTKLRS
ncbi:Endoglucanase H/Glycosyl hydrolase family 26 [Penicillium cf. griseofulvum]|uniref:Endoglucanase H/Glycosyl hydrolase family 26 n=1 Tax=Penicillium cf. griseofulvum TaxID=2972120 RepID=A0A9W9MR08_9EURO|nr:Endoglucanase H/Glycosyl hydrolase family 26 [Penicillium cf. griseofulvum]KAJ5441071.1 Endoglucanase H/Glycosyl hydrolase family 26 [Penicillium cf. griseofulvum]